MYFNNEEYMQSQLSVRMHSDWPKKRTSTKKWRDRQTNYETEASLNCISPGDSAADDSRHV